MADAAPYRKEKEGSGRWASVRLDGCWGFFYSSFLLLIFSLLLLFATDFQEKESRERGQRFRRILNSFQTFLKYPFCLKTFFKRFANILVC
jgi:hypothetical protein